MKRRCGCGRPITARSKTGKCQSCAVTASNLKRIGSANPRWKGDDAAEHAMHRRVHKARGNASKHSCFFCISGQADEWARIHGTDGKSIICYVPACHLCHKGYDYDERFTEATRLKLGESMRGNRNGAGNRKVGLR